MISRPDLLDSKSPPGLEVYQLTADPEQPHTHVYMESHVFTPDSKRFILNRGEYAGHGEFLLCDLENGAELSPIVEELATAPTVSPDGKTLYYFVLEQKPTPRAHLKSVNLDRTNRTTIATIEGPPDGTPAALTWIYPLSTMSSDGQRLMMTAGLGPEHSAYIVFDVRTGDYKVILQGPRYEWSNSHAQYSRSQDPQACHDIMIQHTHGPVDDPPKGHRLGSGDIHVIRDDGTDFRSLPWGRTEDEYAQGHQCWRGQTTWAISSTITVAPTESNPDAVRCELIEAQPCPHVDHIGKGHPDALRNNLTRDLDNPQFYHFGVDRDGTAIIADYFHPNGSPFHPEGKTLLYWARLNEPGCDAATDFTYLLDTRTTFSDSEKHAHPFLSPDGRTGFFNSDESGVLQAYMLRGF